MPDVHLTAPPTETGPSAIPAPRPWRLFWRAVLNFERTKIIPRIALRNSLGVAIPLIVGVLTGYRLSGLAVATGALNVSYSDGEDAYAQRARRMLAATVLTAFAVFIGGFAGRNHFFAVLIAAGWGFVSGLVVCLGTTAGDLGVLSVVTLVVYSAQGLSAVNASWAAVLALLGGLFQTGLAVLFWPAGRYEPERRALGRLYQELAHFASQTTNASDAPPASAASTGAQQMLSTLGQDHRVESERYRSLLNQAERIRLCLLALQRLRRRLHRDASTADFWDPIDRLLAIAADFLHAVGTLLTSNVNAGFARSDLRSFTERLEEFRRVPRHATSSFARALIADVQLQFDALAGQFRAAVDLSENSTPEGLVLFEKRDAARPAALRLANNLATLRANLTLNSAAFRHAIRLAVCLTIGESFGRTVDWRRSYWLPMTIAIVLKPDFTSTFSRGVLRLGGTFAGLALATVLFHLLHPSLLSQVALIAVLTYALRSVGPANYGIFVICISALIVFLVGMTGVSAWQVVSARALNTAAGGLFALAAYWLWPTWEKDQLSEQFARMLDSYRAYFQALTEVYRSQGPHESEKLNAARLGARLARSNVEASLTRLSTEPAVPPARIALAVAMLASSHRLVYALMALDAGLASSTPMPPRAPFKKFASDLDLTLYLLAAALRGSRFVKRQFPDLRSDHRQLIEFGDSTIPRYALVNIETDRLTNSLNTFREQVARLLDK